ncbi:hypothetical protein LCGC14_0695670 [marine sediment metagenome]|uniref:DUF4861 domain-containing protein n=2 Tax=root TaxID=1 RepID=A0A831QQG3_9FLAO|nr:DUF4861 domain-containing protein [Pricia antarctica]
MKQSFNISCAFLLLISVACNDSIEKGQKIQLTNTSQFILNEKPILIQREKLQKPSVNTLLPIVISSNDTLPSQINDTNNDNEWDELFFLVDMQPNEKKPVSIAWVDELPAFKTRTSARFGKRDSEDTPVEPKNNEILLANELPKALGYQQYQTDGPSWENDLVGFRHYLDGRNSKDVFGKKTADISPENVGINAEGAVEDNYHVMEDWGRDILAVGNSVGLGGFALSTDKELLRLGVTVDDSINTIETTTFSIVNEGPVNSVLEYHYENWKPNDRTYQVNELTTIWPGMYGYQNRVSIEGLKGDENLVVGLVNINNDQPLEVLEQNNTYVILMTHDKQSYEKEWFLGMALIVPKISYLGYTEAPKSGNLSNTYLAKFKINNNEPITYFAVAGWELSDKKFVDRSVFKQYVTNLANELSAEVTIKYDKNEE